MLQPEFQKLQKEYKFEVVNGNRSMDAVQRDLQRKIGAMLSIGIDVEATAETPATPVVEKAE